MWSLLIGLRFDFLWARLCSGRLRWPYAVRPDEYVPVSSLPRSWTFSITSLFPFLYPFYSSLFFSSDNGASRTFPYNFQQVPWMVFSSCLRTFIVAVNCLSSVIAGWELNPHHKSWMKSQTLKTFLHTIMKTSVFFKASASRVAKGQSLLDSRWSNAWECEAAGDVCG